jgi:uncharacterized protein YybS (DUF2232 family)
MFLYNCLDLSYLGVEQPMAKHSNIRSLTQGAISASIYLVLLLIVLYIPLINIVALLFLPLPFIVHMFRHGLKSSLLVGAVALLLTVIVAPAPMVTLLMTFMAVSVGLVMGYFYKRGKGAFTPLLAGIIAYIFNYLFALMISYFFFEVNMIAAMEQYVQDMMTMTEETANFLQLPLDEEQLSLYKEYIHWVSYIFPAAMISSAMTMTGLHHLVSSPILTRLGHPIEKLPPFREWRLPKSILFYYLVSLTIILLGMMEEGSTLFLIVVNLQPILEILLYIQGLSVIAYFAHTKGFGKALPIISVIATLLLPILFMVVRIIGIFELGFGLKQRIKPRG